MKKQEAGSKVQITMERGICGSSAEELEVWTDYRKRKINTVAFIRVSRLTTMYPRLYPDFDLQKISSPTRTWK